MRTKHIKGSRFSLRIDRLLIVDGYSYAQQNKMVEPVFIANDSNQPRPEIDYP